MSGASHLPKDTNALLRELRKAFGDYVASEGCACCRNEAAHEKAAARIGKLLRVPKFEDGSGYNFWKYHNE